MSLPPSAGKFPTSTRYLSLREDKECEATIQLMAFINPVIDGELSNYFEWLSGGYFDVATRGGAMHRVESIVSHIYYGFNLSQMFFRIDTQVGLKDESVHGLEFCVHFLMRHRYRVEIAINLKRGKHSVKAKGVRSAPRSRHWIA